MDELEPLLARTLTSGLAFERRVARGPAAPGSLDARLYSLSLYVQVNLLALRAVTWIGAAHLIDRLAGPHTSETTR